MRRRPDPKSTPAKPETAREAYEAWDASASQLGCQESAFLYVALTRALNLKTHCVFVERDFRGVWLLHGCAAFFTGTNALLVDPAYGSFGAPHKAFAILDDVETAGVYLAWKPGLKELRAAVKLAPRVSLVRATLIDALAIENRWDEVRRECRVLAGQDETQGIDLLLKDGDILPQASKLVSELIHRFGDVRLDARDPAGTPFR